MPFDTKAYGPVVQELLELEGGGWRPMPLTGSDCSSSEALLRLESCASGGCFRQCYSPQGVLAGLYLYFSCLEQAHRTAQELSSPEGVFWHAIMHRREPDPGNAAYWFRRLGHHPVFPLLREEAERLSLARPGAGFRPPAVWDPFLFVDFVEVARRSPASEAEQLALEIQRAEWQVLFDHCARPASETLLAAGRRGVA